MIMRSIINYNPFSEKCQEGILFFIKNLKNRELEMRRGNGILCSGIIRSFPRLCFDKLPFDESERLLHRPDQKTDQNCRENRSFPDAADVPETTERK